MSSDLPSVPPGSVAPSPDLARAIVVDAYRWVLGREPDDGGLAHFTAALTDGGMSVIGVIEGLCASEEGKLCRRVVVSDPSLDPASGSANEQAEELVTTLYRLVLLREPDDGGLQSAVHLLLHGDATPMTILRSFLESEEFGQSAARHASVARHLARTIITTLMKRDPGEAAVSAYATSLETGYSVDAFVTELIDSEEFARLRGDAARTSTTSPDALAGLANLAEGLIVAQLMSEGCSFAWPAQTSEPARITQNHVRDSLKTLAMLARTNGRRDPADAAARPEAR